MAQSTLHERLHRIETKRQQLLTRAGAMEAERLTARPRPEKWSTLEILEHLVLAERDVFGDLTAAAPRQPRRRRVRDHLRFVVVMVVLRFDIPVRAPSRAMLPTGARTLDDLRQAWEAHHGQLRALIERGDRTLTRGAIFRHPVAGPLTLRQALLMLEVHLDRHTRQIDALEGR